MNDEMDIRKLIKKYNVSRKEMSGILTRWLYNGNSMTIEKYMVKKLDYKEVME